MIPNMSEIEIFFTISVCLCALILHPSVRNVFCCSAKTTKTKVINLTHLYHSLIRLRLLPSTIHFLHSLQLIPWLWLQWWFPILKWPFLHLKWHLLIPLFLHLFPLSINIPLYMEWVVDLPTWWHRRSMVPSNPIHRFDWYHCVDKDALLTNITEWHLKKYKGKEDMEVR